MAREEHLAALSMQELVRRASEEARRLRDLEQRLETMEERVRGLEEQLIDRFKKIDDRLGSLEAANRASGDELIRLKTSIDKISKQVDKSARKTDLKELEKMIELLSPVAEHVRKELREEVPIVREA